MALHDITRGIGIPSGPPRGGFGLPPTRPTGPSHRTGPAPPPDRSPVYGDAIPVVIGTGRAKAQLVLPGVAGAGQLLGNVYVGETLTSFKVWWVDAAVYAICEAPVTDVLRMWNGNVPAAGISTATFPSDSTRVLTVDGGTVDIIKTATATAWAALAGGPAAGMGFSGTCHMRAAKLFLRPEDGSRPQLEFEVKSTLADAASPDGKDALAADALIFLLTDAKSGIGLSTSIVDVDLGADRTAASSYRRHCAQRGLWVSRVLLRGDNKLDVIQSLLDATDATLIKIDGKYRAIPMADRPVGTFTPDTSFQTISDDDFFFGAGEHIVVERLGPQDRNLFPVQFSSRGVDYHELTVDGFDPAAIADVGTKRAEVFEVPWTITEAHAKWLADTLALRALTSRNKYTLQLKPKWGAILVPTDFLQVTESKTIGLANRLVRVTRVRHHEGGIEVEAIEWLSIEASGMAAQTAAGILSTDLIHEPPAMANLSNVADATVTANKLRSISDRDNLWPNPSSEEAPPLGADLTQPEWADRVNAGAGAYSGSWVRQAPAPLATPVNATFTQGAGTLATGTYYYRVTAFNAGETLASTETSLAITGPAGINVNWGAVAGATGYRIYGRTTGAELLLAEVGAVTTWLDNGSLTPAGPLPSVNTTSRSGFWIPCSPSAQFYAEAQAKRTAGTGLGGRLNIGFYSSLGSFAGGTVTSGAYSTSGSWAKVTVSSAAAPAGTNAAYISYEAGSGDVVQFDAFLARRIMQPETIASEIITLSAGTGWNGAVNVRRSAAMICGIVGYQAGSSSSFTSILTLPAGARPLADMFIPARFYDNSNYMPAIIKITASTGVISLPEVLAAGVFATPPTLASGMAVYFNFAFNWI